MEMEDFGANIQSFIYTFLLAQLENSMSTQRLTYYLNVGKPLIFILSY